MGGCGVAILLHISYDYSFQLRKETEAKAREFKLSPPDFPVSKLDELPLLQTITQEPGQQDIYTTFLTTELAEWLCHHNHFDVVTNEYRKFYSRSLREKEILFLVAKKRG